MAAFTILWSTNEGAPLQLLLQALHTSPWSVNEKLDFTEKKKGEREREGWIILLCAICKNYLKEKLIKMREMIFRPDRIVTNLVFT